METTDGLVSSLVEDVDTFLVIGISLIFSGLVAAASSSSLYGIAAGCVMFILIMIFLQLKKIILLLMKK